MKDELNIFPIIEKLRAEGDISREDLPVIRQAVEDWKYKISGKEQSPVLQEWYQLVLKNLREGKTGTFVETVPLQVNSNFNAYSKIDETAGLIYEILSLLPLSDRMFEIIVSKNIQSLFPENEKVNEDWAGPFYLSWAGELKSIYSHGFKPIRFLSFDNLFRYISDYYREKSSFMPYYFCEAVAIKAMAKMNISFIWGKYIRFNGKYVGDASIFLSSKSRIFEKVFAELGLNRLIKYLAENGFIGCIHEHNKGRCFYYVKCSSLYLFDRVSDMFIEIFKEKEIKEEKEKLISDEWLEYIK